MSQELGPSAFISHSFWDLDFVKLLARDLERHGIKTWVDIARIRPGDDLVSKIEEGLKNSTHVIVVLSPKSIISSWVREESHAAQLKSIEGSIKLIPLLIGDLNAKDIPLLLQSKLYADFRDPLKYSDAFSTLLLAFDVNPIEGVTEKAEVLMPGIEDMNILQMHGSSGYAIEVLFTNPSFKQVLVRRVTIGCVKYPSLAMVTPGIYTYELSLDLQKTPEEDTFLIHGLAKEPEDSWGRPASGFIHRDGGHYELEISCPIYLLIEPKERSLIRFIIKEPKFLDSDKNLNALRTEFQLPSRSEPSFWALPSLSKHIRKGNGTWIILEGDWDKPIGTAIHSWELLQIFKVQSS